MGNLKKGSSFFHLIGKVKLTDMTFELDKESTKSKWIGSKMNLAVDCGDGNIIYSRMFGGYNQTNPNTIRVYPKSDNNGFIANRSKGSEFYVDWEDRENSKTISKVAKSCLLAVGIERDTKGKIFTKYFLSQYDAIPYIKEHLKDDITVTIKGNLNYNYYDNIVRLNKEIQSISLSNAKPEDFKAEFVQTILLDKDSVGKFDKEQGMFPIYAYVPEYVWKLDGIEIKNTIAFPYEFGIDSDEENVDLIKRVLVDKYFKVTKEDIFDEVTVKGRFFDGLEVKEVTEEDLAPDIRALVAAKRMTLEEALGGMTTGRKSRKKLISHPVFKKISGKDTPDDSLPEPMVIKSKYKTSELLFLSSVTANVEEKELNKNSENKPNLEFDNYLNSDSDGDLPF